MQTGENSIIAARILYHSNSYTVLLFAVKYNFMALWLFTKLNSIISVLYLASCILILHLWNL